MLHLLNQRSACFSQVLEGQSPVNDAIQAVHFKSISCCSKSRLHLCQRRLKVCHTHLQSKKVIFGLSQQHGGLEAKLQDTRAYAFCALHVSRCNVKDAQIPFLCSLQCLSAPTRRRSCVLCFPLATASTILKTHLRQLTWQIGLCKSANLLPDT